MIRSSREFDDMDGRPAPWAFSAARILLGVTLLAAPLPYGSVYPWAWASITILTMLVLILWMVGTIQKGKLRIVFLPVYWPLALFLVLGLIQLLFHITLAPTATVESLLKLATYILLFFVVIQLFVDSPVETWHRVGIAVSVFGFVFSFLSILQFFWNPVRIIWVGHDLATPFGPYVDRDHFAGLMEMVAPVSGAYVLSLPKGAPQNGMLWFGVLVQIVSLLLTGSRGGFLSVLVEIVLLAWILIRRTPLRGRRMKVAASGLAIVALAALFIWLVPTYVLTKLGSFNSYTPEAGTGGRLALWRSSLGILREHPVLGTGMGTFVTAYPPFATNASDLITEHAHNDYVEALAETGLLGGVLILAVLLLFFPIMFRNLSVQLLREPGWIQLGAAVACCGLLVHSFVDFNLHIPANAAWFGFCAGLASFSGRMTPRRGEVTERAPGYRPSQGRTAGAMFPLV